MFNSLRGRLSGKGTDSIFLDTGGIEWDIAVPSICLDDFGRVGDETRVLAWLQHREDQMHLFGFPDESTRSAFLELLKVDGIGPRQAMKILSGIRVAELESALEAEDLAAIERAPGVGRKTAQKILLALKGKLATRLPEPRKRGAGELAKALAEMGFDVRRAQAAVDAAESEIKAEKSDFSPEELEQEIFKRALVSLGSER